MEKWIFVNHITSLDKLYYLTKAIKENLVTKDNHARLLMNTLNENGANITKANNHLINYVLFYNMVYYNNGKYELTSNGINLVNNYHIISNDRKLRAEYFFNVLNHIEYPNVAVETSDIYQLHPFNIIFKLLCDNRLNNRISIEEMENFLSICHTDDEYNLLVEQLLKYRRREILNIECEKIAQIPTVVAGWCNQFNVMKREGEFVMISDDLKSLLPVLTEENNFNALPYNNKFINFVLKKYLFEGLSMSNIENNFFNTNNRRGFLVKEVLDYFNINKEENKALYSGKNLNLICEFLEVQSDIRYKNIASILKEEYSDVIVEKVEENNYKTQDRIKKGYNMIYYGTPGSGKSYKVNQDFNEKEYLVYRTTFHPEYSNSDFVGQIIPKTENNEIKYEFQVGPFSIALLDAIKNPSKKVCLIIEEINRGNASAIFGDIFQLLDRNSDGSSVYSIVNEPIKNYLRKNKINVDKITIPSNLWIIATMNTSDQNVFTLDTAFKRRWRMHRIINEFDLTKDYDKKLASMYIPGSSYTWEQFITTINKEIMRKNPTGLNSEDKQLGVYFVTENELSSKAIDTTKEVIDKFVEKVLLYIWDDIAKIDSALWFGENIKCFDELVKEYYKNNLRVFKDMFTDQISNESQVRESNEENN